VLSVDRHHGDRQAEGVEAGAESGGREPRSRSPKRRVVNEIPRVTNFIDKGWTYPSLIATLAAMSNSLATRVEEASAERGLVVARPQRGFRVREFSVEDIVGLTESRVQIESVALRLAIERGDVQWERQIVAAYHLLERTPVVDDNGNYREEWGVRHRDFHQALTAGCNNARLQEVVLGLRASAELYRRWWWALAIDRPRDPAAGHRQLIDLSLARNADAAIEALAYHIKRTPDQLIAYAHEHSLDDLNGPPWQAN
jgi:DNA-binding GntR family transcriptional regulator